jgi:hypothetical protein
MIHRAGDRVPGAYKERPPAGAYKKAIERVHASHFEHAQIVTVSCKQKCFASTLAI